MKKNIPELKMTYSCVLTKEKQKIVYVSFEREGAYAEGIVPSGVMEKSSGFTPEELKQLSEYLICNTDDILTKAREVNPLRSWIKKE